MIIRNHSFLIFLTVFMIRNVLEIRRVIVFRLGIPRNGKITLLFLFLIYALSVIISLLGIYLQQPSFFSVFITGIVLYTLSFLFREMSTMQMRQSYDNDFTDRGHPLITGGIFRIIRHPIYLFYILETASLILIYISIFGIILLTGFLVLILIRIDREERFLVQTYGECYVQYQKKSKRLLPFIY